MYISGRYAVLGSRQLPAYAKNAASEIFISDAALFICQKVLSLQPLPVHSEALLRSAPLFPVTLSAFHFFQTSFSEKTGCVWLPLLLFPDSPAESFE